MLKILAMIFMLVDHIGLVLYPDIIVLRICGRLSMPIFAFYIAKGYYYTKDYSTGREYLTRLFVLMCAAQLPYMLMTNKWNLSIVASWVGGYLGLLSIDRLITIFKLNKVVSKHDEGSMKDIMSINSIVASVPYLLILIVGYVLLKNYAEYGAMAFCLVLVFYPMAASSINRGIVNGISLVPAALIIYFNQMSHRGSIMWYGILGLIVIYYYEKIIGRIGVDVIVPKIIGYGFYPSHMILLYLVRVAIK